MSKRRMLLVLLFGIVLLVGACATEVAELTRTPPEPTSAPETVTPPVPTLTPMPLPAPRLLSRTPEGGQTLGLDAPLEVTFDQAMDRSSVEAAFGISPTVEGSFAWGNERSVSFVPSLAEGAGLARGTRYEVTIDPTARSAEGLPLEEAISFTFETAGYLTVSQVMPAPDSEDLDPNSSVTVIFDHPVVPLGALSQGGTLPTPLTFMPPVRGQGEWLNTSIYQFHPEEGLLPATRYIARVAAGLTDTSGGLLAEDYVWEFATIQPAILDFAPARGFAYLGPTDVISVTFNQPMDHTSAQERFALTLQPTAGEAKEVAGSFRWSGGEEPTSPETMVFVPGTALPRESELVATVAAGARARVGTMTTDKDLTWRFSTVKEPGIVRTSPRDGDRGVAPGETLSIVFASPMEQKGFLNYLTIRGPEGELDLEATKVYSYWAEYDTELQIGFEQEPATSYRVTVGAETPDRYGAPLGQATNIRFTTGDLSSYASLQTTGRLGTYSAYTDTVVYVSHRNVSRLNLTLYRVSPTEFVKLNTDWEAWDRYVPSEENLVRQWARQPTTARNQTGLARFDLVGAQDEPLPPGLYYAVLTSPDVPRPPDSRPAGYLFSRSRLNLTLKQTRSEVLVWATDLADGQPLPDLSVILHGEEGRLGEIDTDDEGMGYADDLPIDDLWRSLFAFSGEPGYDDFGLAYNNWDEGITPWSFGLDAEFWASKYQGYLYTDRPIYRPGQTVHYKGIVRADDDADYRLPDEIETVEIRVSDPQGKELDKKKVPLSDMGTFFEDLTLDGEAALGTYFVEIQNSAADLFASTTFDVAEYKKPEFQVSVSAERDGYLSGETIEATAEATYYFGGPVTDADVLWSALSSDYFYSYECPAGQTCPWYSWSDYEWGSFEDEYYYGDSGRLIAEEDTVTDEAGRATLALPADISGEKQSQRFTLEASVTDLNGQQVSSRSAVVVHKGAFYTGVAPRGYLAEVGEEKWVDLLTVDWDGEPVSGVELTVVLMEHNWYSVRRQAEDGQFYWDWTSEDVPVQTKTVTTAADGKAEIAFTPLKAGSYKVRATGRDDHENEVRSAAYFWVWGGDGYVQWRQESTSRIELIPDREEYEVGDVAEILIPSPYSGTVQALVTVERGHILSREVRRLASNSEVLRIPINEESVPNVFVSVVIVQGSEQAADQLSSFKMGMVKLPVSLTSKKLSITLTPDRDMDQGEYYGPRQQATYDVLVTDQEGQPLEAELSLRLADLAVLALADEPGQTLLETFWRNRGLGVRTSTPLVVAMEAYNRELRPEQKGGGGGEGLVRSQFADTAFWDPVVRTGKDGKAQVTVQLPDNLTTWRMQARGITANTQVGQAEVDVLSTLDLLVRPVLPRFFVGGDKAELATIVHNNTDDELDVQVNISAEGLVIQGASSQRATVAAGERAKVTWPAEALPGDDVRVRMWASAGDLYDGREDVLPVYQYSTPEVVATSGQLAEAGVRQELVQLPTTLDPTQGELAVQLDGSLTAATGDALAYLEHYPYECIEQTVSRFLPNVVTWRILEEMGLDRPEMEQHLAQMVGIALQRLYAQQHYDGGWGWWVTDKSDAYLTAYALHGMLEAQRAGFVVDAAVMDHAADYLRDNLPSMSRVDTHWEANRLAYELYVLAEVAASATEGETGGARGELGLAVRLFEARHLLDLYGQATLAVALHLLEPDEPGRVQTLLGDLAGDAVASATGSHWEESEPDYWNMNTDIRTTAIVLWAMARLEPDGQMLPSTVRWLMSARQEGYWETTQATAWSLLGLAEYMRASGELEGDYDYSVYLNGQELGSGEVSAETIDQSHQLRVDIAQLAADEVNRLVIERQPAQPGQSGEGQLYYTAHLRYYLPADHVQALERGIYVARQYSPVEQPGTYVDRVQVGDVVKVKLTLIVPHDLHYVVVEDSLPAGFEGVDLSLKTSSVVGERPELRNVTAEEENRWYRQYGWGWWWFSHSELRDEKVALFAQYLPRGTYEYTYLMRASVPGEFLVMPASAYEMYFPEVFGRSDGGKFIVEPSP